MTRAGRDWPRTAAELADEQTRIAGEIWTAWRPLGPVFASAPATSASTRGGPGDGAAGDRGWAAAAVGDEAVVVEGNAPAEYEPGLLALREGELLERAVQRLKARPEVLIVDSTGRDHPRRCGLALQLGAKLDLPTVGVTHRPLDGERRVARRRTRGDEPAHGGRRACRLLGVHEAGSTAARGARCLAHGPRGGGRGRARRHRQRANARPVPARSHRGTAGTRHGDAGGRLTGLMRRPERWRRWLATRSRRGRARARRGASRSSSLTRGEGGETLRAGSPSAAPAAGRAAPSAAARSRAAARIDPKRRARRRRPAAVSDHVVGRVHGRLQDEPRRRDESLRGEPLRRHRGTGERARPSCALGRRRGRDGSRWHARDRDVLSGRARCPRDDGRRAAGPRRRAQASASSR